jgi:hypothetical protein
VKPQPLFVGPSTDHTHEEVVKLYAESIGSEYTRGEFWGQWVIGGKACWVTLVAAAPADWRFAVFEDGPYFKIN